MQGRLKGIKERKAEGILHGVQKTIEYLLSECMNPTQVTVVRELLTRQINTTKLDAMKSNLLSQTLTTTKIATLVQDINSILSDAVVFDTNSTEDIIDILFSEELPLLHNKDHNAA